MKTIASVGLCAVLLSGAACLFGQAMPEMPPPQKEHELLQQFVGDWEMDLEITMDPSQPVMKGKMTERTRSLGGFWIIADGTGTMEGMPGTMTNVMTLGYDPAAKKYVGTWVDSMTSTMWRYEGTVDSSGKILTLETEGPCPTKPGTIAKFRDVTEFKGKDQRVFTSFMQGEDGKWTIMSKGQARRTK